MAIRSTQLALVNSATANAEVTIFTCPAGQRALVKYLTLVSLATAPGLMAVVIRPASLGSFGSVLRATGTQGVPVEKTGLYAMLEPGDVLRALVASTTGGGWAVLVGGLLFDL